MPKTMASRSMAKPARMAGWLRAKRSPVRMAARGDSPVAAGRGWGGRAAMAAMAAAKLATSMP